MSPVKFPPHNWLSSMMPPPQDESLDAYLRQAKLTREEISDLLDLGFELKI